MGFYRTGLAFTATVEPIAPIELVEPIESLESVEPATITSNITPPKFMPPRMPLRMPNSPRSRRPVSNRSNHSNRRGRSNRSKDALDAVSGFYGLMDNCSNCFISTAATGAYTGDSCQAVINQYVFCGNNPVNFTDPFGLKLVVQKNAELARMVQQVQTTDIGKRMISALEAADATVYLRMGNAGYTRGNTSFVTYPGDIMHELEHLGEFATKSKDPSKSGVDCSHDKETTTHQDENRAVRAQNIYNSQRYELNSFASSMGVGFSARANYREPGSGDVWPVSCPFGDQYKPQLGPISWAP